MLKKLTTNLLLIFFLGNVSAQYNFEPGPGQPFGLPNPKAPKQLLDWAPLIGECDCKSVMRNPDQTWADTVDMIWRFKYIMNGWGVQDETLKSDGVYSGSIRQYIADSSRWYVHYYSSTGPTSKLPTWEGNKNENGDIVLYRDQKAPNGMEGWYKITFSNISKSGFDWLGEWVNKDETISFPTWVIKCKRRAHATDDINREQIFAKIKAFSKAYMNADYEGIANAYTSDGKIFPGGARIIEGRKAIQERWTIKDGSKILHHQIDPEEINFLGDYAYDYGYYSGKTQKADGTISEWQGKYVIVWKKINGDWQIYLDIWNRT